MQFPTRRIPLEAVILLLADEFEIPCATEEVVWRPALAEADRLFREIAHDPQP